MGEREGEKSGQSGHLGSISGVAFLVSLDRGCLLWVIFLISATFACWKVTLTFLGFSVSVKNGLDQRISEDLLWFTVTGRNAVGSN